MNILSLFDGMSCGMLAMMEAGVPVDRYVAYEIDKYAVQTSKHNFPMIEQMGDVFAADFTQYQDFDFLIGGSPCTYWSIAQKNNRETEASGLGWELFSQYVRALHEAKPKFFIYENNKSMAKAIRDSIRETFGFEEICINSALVSAQNRQRFYWVGKRNEDGTYSKVDVQQPEDRGILLKDILDGAEVYRSAKSGKGFCLDASYWKTPGSPETFLEGAHARANRNMVAEPVPFGETHGKSYALTASYYKDQPNERVLTKCQRTKVAEPVRVGCYPFPDRTIKNSQGMRIYSIEGKSVNQTAQGGGMGAKTGLYAGPVAGRIVGRRINTDGHRDDYNTELEHVQRHEVNGDPQKTNCVTTVSKDNMVAAPIYQYATPTEFDSNGKPIKAISGADGKTYTVYEVSNGQITIKRKTYPIKLIDGYYIIRKLTVRECMRLQTVPEWFEFPVSDTQAYKQLGNGWTVLVISHLINACIFKRRG